MTVDMLQQVAAALTDAGLPASVEYPGYVAIVRPYGLFHAGTGNEHWSADFYADPNDTSRPDGGIETVEPSTSQNAARIAGALIAAMAQFHACGGVGR